MSRTQKVCISGFTVDRRREIVIAALHKSSMGDGNEHCVEICRQIDKAALRDGFRSFPSGFATCELSQLPNLTDGRYSRRESGMMD